MAINPLERASLLPMTAVLAAAAAAEGAKPNARRIVRALLAGSESLRPA
jgi:hypothetical protein